MNHKKIVFGFVLGTFMNINGFATTEGSISEPSSRQCGKDTYYCCQQNDATAITAGWYPNHRGQGCPTGTTATTTCTPYIFYQNRGLNATPNWEQQQKSPATCNGLGAFVRPKFNTQTIECTTLTNGKYIEIYYTCCRQRGDTQTIGFYPSKQTNSLHTCPAETITAPLCHYSITSNNDGMLITGVFYTNVGTSLEPDWESENTSVQCSP